MTLAQQRAQAAAAAAIAHAQAHIRRQPEPPNPDDVYITPDIARAIRHRIEAQETNRHA